MQPAGPCVCTRGRPTTTTQRRAASFFIEACISVYNYIYDVQGGGRPALCLCHSQRRPCLMWQSWTHRSALARHRQRSVARGRRAVCSGVTWWHGAPVSSSPVLRSPHCPAKVLGPCTIGVAVLLSDGCLIRHVPAALLAYTSMHTCRPIQVCNYLVRNLVGSPSIWCKWEVEKPVGNRYELSNSILPIHSLSFDNCNQFQHENGPKQRSMTRTPCYPLPSQHEDFIVKKEGDFCVLFQCGSMGWVNKETSSI